LARSDGLGTDQTGWNTLQSSSKLNSNLIHFVCHVTNLHLFRREVGQFLGGTKEGYKMASEAATVPGSTGSNCSVQGPMSTSVHAQIREAGQGTAHGKKFCGLSLPSLSNILKMMQLYC